jgi:hypothetical protein
VVDYAGLRRLEVVGRFKYAVIVIIIFAARGRVALMGFADLASEAIDRPALAPGCERIRINRA